MTKIFPILFIAALLYGCADADNNAAVEQHEHAETTAESAAHTTISAAMARASGIVTAPVGPGEIRAALVLYGTIAADATRLRAVSARYPGIVRRVDVAAGDSVRAGQVLASVESNESLQVYAVTAPIAGTVVQRRTNPGEAAAAEPLFEIADYSSVWAQLNVFPRDRTPLRNGQPVQVRAADGAGSADSTIAAIVNSGGQPGVHARVVLDNRTHQWTPGQFVNATVTVATTTVALAVPVAALQTLNGRDVVFVNSGEDYRAQPVQTGARDGDFVEITGGLAAGNAIVVAHSYVVKADIEKSGAGHSH